MNVKSKWVRIMAVILAVAVGLSFTVFVVAWLV